MSRTGGWISTLFFAVCRYTLYEDVVGVLLSRWPPVIIRYSNETLQFRQIPQISRMGGWISKKCFAVCIHCIGVCFECRFTRVSSLKLLAFGNNACCSVTIPNYLLQFTRKEAKQLWGKRSGVGSNDSALCHWWTRGEAKLSAGASVEALVGTIKKM